MIEQLTGFDDNVVAFRCLGRVTKADYVSVLVPAVAEALRAHRKVRLYYETGPDFSLDPGAAWEDFKVGMKNITRWERVAVVTDVGWIKHAVQLFRFLMPGVTKLFSQAEAAQARAWIGCLTGAVDERRSSPRPR